MKTISISGSTALWTWRVHQHHGWRLLHSDYCDTRAEFNASCDHVAREASTNSSDSPSLFTSREEYEECAYYTPTWPAGCAAAVAYSRSNVSFYPTTEDAETALDKATLEHGYSILLADMGNHAGPCNVVEAADISIRLAGTPISFDAPTPDHVFTAQDVSDALGDNYDCEHAASVLNTHLKNYQGNQ
jgi:hypothetical protein